VYRAVPRETLDLNTKSQTTRKVIHNNSGIVINIGLPLWDFPSATRKRSSPYATYYAVRNVFYSNANSSKSIATDTGSGHCTLVFVWSLHMGSIYINLCPAKVANRNNWLPHEARGKNLHLCARFAHDSRVRIYMLITAPAIISLPLLPLRKGSTGSRQLLAIEPPIPGLTHSLCPVIIPPLLLHLSFV
jgi:hypothetical protein